MASLEEMINVINMVSKLAQGTVDTDNSKDKVGNSNNMKKSKKRIITFGRWGDLPLEWTVLREGETKVFCLCNQIPYFYTLDRNSKFEMSNAYDCLEKKFYNKAFNRDEQKLIVNHKIADKNKIMKRNVFLLSEEESEKLLSKSDKKLDMNWLLRSYDRNSSDELVIKYVNTDGDVLGNSLNDVFYIKHSFFGSERGFKIGLRPAIIIRK